MSASAPTTSNPNQALWEKGDFTQIAETMRESGAERLSVSGPPGYSDFIPFARRIVETFPGRVLWGTDWPHPNMKSHMPDDGDLVNLLPLIAPTPELQRALLVDNPTRLYWDK